MTLTMLKFTEKECYRIEASINQCLMLPSVMWDNFFCPLLHIIHLVAILLLSGESYDTSFEQILFCEHNVLQWIVATRSFLFNVSVQIQWKFILLLQRRVVISSWLTKSLFPIWDAFTNNNKSESLFRCTATFTIMSNLKDIIQK